MKTTTTKHFQLLAIVLLVSGLAVAGTLDPPGPPAPTMITLQQIFDKMCAPADLAKTGQTTCFDAAGSSIACAGTGQDAAFARGVAVSPRFTDNGNGTVRDNLTGLIWLKNANCFGNPLWTTALSNANTLASGSCGLTDGSVAGDWRLPNIRELVSLIDYGRFGPALPAGHPFTGVLNTNYWSSTSHAVVPNYAWNVNIDNGFFTSYDKAQYNLYVWPVRGGP